MCTRTIKLDHLLRIQRSKDKATLRITCKRNSFHPTVAHSELGLHRLDHRLGRNFDTSRLVDIGLDLFRCLDTLTINYMLLQWRYDCCLLVRAFKFSFFLLHKVFLFLLCVLGEVVDNLYFDVEHISYLLAWHCLRSSQLDNLKACCCTQMMQWTTFLAGMHWVSVDTEVQISHGYRWGTWSPWMRLQLFGLVYSLVLVFFS